MTEKLIENDEFEPRDVCNKGQTLDDIECSHAVVSLIIVKGHFSSSALRDPYQRSGWTTKKFVPKKLSLMKMCHKNSKVKRDVLLQRCHWHESFSTAPSKAKSEGLGTRLSPAPEVFSVVVSLTQKTSVIQQDTHSALKEVCSVKRPTIFYCSEVNWSMGILTYIK